MDKRPLRCLYASSEVTGFAKTGGLADVAGSLPRALAERGMACAVILPLYRCVKNGPLAVQPTDHTFQVQIGHRTVPGRLWRSTLPDADVPVYLVEQADYFERDDPAQGRGIYQYTALDGQVRDYQDNHERYIFFARAVLEALRLLDFQPDVLHANDWQTGLIPVYLREVYRQHPNWAVRPHYESIRTLFTIHNLAYQGLFPAETMVTAGLPWRLFTFDGLEFYGHVNFLKAGIVYADRITTVSPMYAREIQTPYYGCGLQGVLAQRRADLFGIVNGVDYRTWNPASDPLLAARYDATTLAQSKRVCKQALQKHYGLAEMPGTPVFGLISRLAEQKGIDILVPIIPDLLGMDCQLVILGMGNPKYHQILAGLQRRHATRMGLSLAQDEKLAHMIEAGADMFLMPSQYEPCGLNQLYSLKYGTVPLVRATGGLADTVVDANSENVAAGIATGFSFQVYSSAALLEAVKRALAVYRELPDQWRSLQEAGMRQDWSWSRSAAEYETLYQSVARRP